MSADPGAGRTNDEPDAWLPSSDVLVRRFGLSRRQAETALLLAVGCTNRQAAARLDVSPHTARHFVEQVMFKLSVRSRAAVAAKIARAASVSRGVTPKHED